MRGQATTAKASRSPGLRPAPSVAFPAARWASWAWLIVRLYAGWRWLDAGWSKTDSAAWFDATAWNRSPLRSIVAAVGPDTLANAIAVGEVLIGIAILLGVFTAIAAFAGVAAGLGATLVGVASPSLLPLLATAALAVGWRGSGRIGFDRWLLPTIGHGRGARHEQQRTTDADRLERQPGR